MLQDPNKLTDKTIENPGVFMKYERCLLRIVGSLVLNCYFGGFSRIFRAKIPNFLVNQSVI
jgi:hypothetical protein